MIIVIRYWVDKLNMHFSTSYMAWYWSTQLHYLIEGWNVQPKPDNVWFHEISILTPWKVNSNPKREGGSQLPKFIRGWEGSNEKKLSCGEVWICSGATQWTLQLSERHMNFDLYEATHSAVFHMDYKVTKQDFWPLGFHQKRLAKVTTEHTQSCV